MCPPAIIGGLKFLAPIILPSLVNRFLGGNKQQGQTGPKDYARGLATKKVKTAVAGEDLVVEDEESKAEAARTEQALDSAKRKLKGTDNLKSKKQPGQGTEETTKEIKDATETSTGHNLGNTAPAY